MSSTCLHQHKVWIFEEMCELATEKLREETPRISFAIVEGTEGSGLGILLVKIRSSILKHEYSPLVIS